MPHPTLPSHSFPGPVAVIGDIHGCAGLLDALLAELGDLPLVTVGDVGDRGPDTRAVIDRLVERRAIGVQGNHDIWLRRWAMGGGFDTFALSGAMGGDATLRSYGVTGRSVREIEGQAWRVPDAHRGWLRTLPVALELVVGEEPFWVTHAGLARFVSVEAAAPERRVEELVRFHGERMLWPATAPESSLDTGRTVIMGHVPQAEPVDIGSVIALDTGAGKDEMGGRLSAVVLPERRFVTVG